MKCKNSTEITYINTIFKQHMIKKSPGTGLHESLFSDFEILFGFFQKVPHRIGQSLYPAHKKNFILKKKLKIVTH